MQPSADFDRLVKLIKEVKPGLTDQVVNPADSLTDNLGLDSLNLLQLSRKIHRDMGVDFDLEEWDGRQETHNRSVESILVVVTAGASS